jgi:hypothetical protein
MNIVKHDKGFIPTAPIVKSKDDTDNETSQMGMGNIVSRRCGSSNTKHQAELGGERDGYDGNTQSDTENTV